ncbi:MAG: phage tail sheath C-terminal domain-containing protein, partial [Anaerolineae bacterium]
GNDLTVNVWDAEEHAFIEDEEHSGSEGPPIALNRTPVVKSARNRVRLHTDADGLTRSLQILYDDDAAAPVAGQVKINRASGELTFGDAVAAADTVTASYVVNMSSAVKVTLRLGDAEEVYTIVDGDDLVSDINDESAWADAEALANSAELPDKSIAVDAFASFSGGDNGAAASDADYKGGFEKLLNEPAHIMVAAGKDDIFGDELDAHAQVASSDANRRERIAVVGSALGASIDDLRGHTLASDRVIFVAPGIKVTDGASGEEVTLPGAYAAAAVAGLLAGFSAHISPTNKTIRVGGLEQRYTSAELTQLVQNRVLALEQRLGFRIVKGITTSTNTAWHQITTRRIVDFAKFGVRSAANPYIGLLNNERVRGALRSTINSFLTEMVQDEMLVSYELDVTATRQEEIKGIVRVIMVLRPVFSIDFIKVTMFLE